jgi:hypothetical protein
VLSRRVANDQAALVELIGQVTELAGGGDLGGGPAQ